MSRRDDIIEKALVCIDEVYPASDAPNASFFPVDKLLDEAARSVVRIVPLQALGAGQDIPAVGFMPAADGSGIMLLPEDFVRLIRFRVKGWQRPVIVPIYDTDTRYIQQFNPVLRGGEARPVVVLCENAKRLEYYSSQRGAGAMLLEASYYGFTVVGDNYPMRLIDITAWKVAEMVLATMNDVSSMQLCTARVNELLQAL